MRLPRVATDADDTSAGRQLARGFPALRFEPELEWGFALAYGARYRLACAISYGVLCVVVALLAFYGKALPAAALAAVLIPAAFLCIGLIWAWSIALALAALAPYWIVASLRAPQAQAVTLTLAAIHGGVLLLAAILGYLRERSARLAYLQTLLINHLGERDGLTQLANRRAFDRYLEAAWQQCADDKALLVLLLVDIDNFRKFNDRYGLAAGDDCVRRVAGAVAASAARPLDHCARYSGVQFAVLLANPDRLYAEDLPARVRSAVAALAIAHPDSPNGRHVTVSVGVALTVPRANDSREAFVALAQDALREAHDAGGNRIAARESESSMVRTGMFQAEVTLAAARRG